MKKGITISTLTIAVTVMLILVSVSTVIGINSIRTASYEEYLSKLTRVANDVNFYLKKHTTLPIKNEIVSKEGLPIELRNLIANNGDKDNELYVVDMEKIKTETVNIGYGTVEDMDVFVVANNTNNIYYLKGYKYKGEMYYGKAGITTLGNLVASAADYGKEVNYVSDNGVTGWKIFYKQTVGSEEYVYLIASEELEYAKVPSILSETVTNGGAGATVIAETVSLGTNNTRTVGQISWSGTPLGVKVAEDANLKWMANWSDYTMATNTKAVSYFLDESIWDEFKNTIKYKDANGQSYVKGAIGTPTVEMFVESWNDKRLTETNTDKIELTLSENGTTGYFVNGSSSTSISTSDSLYIWSTISKTSIWLSAPSGGDSSYLIYAGGSGLVESYSTAKRGVRPVVCLNAKIPAKIDVDGNFVI